MNDTIKAIVTICGDPSVGIPTVTIEVDVGLYYDDVDEGDLSYFREEIKRCYENIHGEKVLVVFDREVKTIEEHLDKLNKEES